MARFIVVGVDESEGSRCAVRWSAQLARDLGAEVQAVHVESRFGLWELSAIQIDIGPYLDEMKDLLRGAWTEALREIGATYHTELVRGDAATELLRIADDLDAFVLVAGARKRLHHTHFIGGTAHKLVNRARRPVILVPPDS